jgi:murein DD-endopeptidase MepM/ murein hydrolase activator NlpD
MPARSNNALPEPTTGSMAAGASPISPAGVAAAAVVAAVLADPQKRDRHELLAPPIRGFGTASGPHLAGAIAELGTVAVALGPAGDGPAAARPQSPYRAPLDGNLRVVRRFDPPAQPWLAGHRGVDLAALPGAVVRSAGDGDILYAGRIAGRGVVSIGHAGGLRTTYEPVVPTVARGDHVGAGDPIGILEAGHAGCPVAACLHWGLRRGDTYLDPLLLIGWGRMRLLPLSGTAVSSASRAGRAASPRAGRSRRRGCRPARTAAASRDPPMT